MVNLVEPNKLLFDNYGNFHNLSHFIITGYNLDSVAQMECVFMYNDNAYYSSADMLVSCFTF